MQSGNAETPRAKEVRALVGRWLCVFTVCVCASSALADRLVTLDGQAVESDITSINAAGQVMFSGDNDAVDLQALRRIERNVAKQNVSKTITVYLSTGGSILADTIGLNEDAFAIRWTYGQQNLSIDAVRALRLMPALESPAGFERAIEGESEKDRLFVLSGKKLLPVSGVLYEINDKDVVFEYQGKQRTVAVSKVYGIVLASAGQSPDYIGKCKLTMADSSAIWGTVTKLDNGQIHLTLSEGIDLTLPWSAVHRIEVRSDRMVFLSDLDPTKVKQKATITYPWPWQRDRSVFSKPLTMKKRVYERGIGMHATCNLSFTNNRKFAVFAATIGIDDETKGRGDCVFRVLGDGRELFSRRMKGGDNPVELQLKIHDINVVTLVADHGEGFDLADHANWCDARFIREGQ